MKEFESGKVIKGKHTSNSKCVLENRHCHTNNFYFKFDQNGSEIKKVLINKVFLITCRRRHLEYII